MSTINTRRRLIELAKAPGIKVQERPLTLDETKSAAEASLTSTTSFVTAVIKNDDTILVTGRPSSRTMHFQQLYMDFIDQKYHASQPIK